MREPNSEGDEGREEPGTTAELCLALATLLENGDLAALDLARRERQRLMDHLGPRGTTILSAIEVFDFPLALTELRQSEITHPAEASISAAQGD